MERAEVVWWDTGMGWGGELVRAIHELSILQKSDGESPSHNDGCTPTLSSGDQDLSGENHARYTLCDL